MKIVIAPDSFKGSMEAHEVAHAISRGIKKIDSAIETVLLPIADGGEGTMISLINATDGEVVEELVTNPLGDKIAARYGILGDRKTAVIEIAEASGLLKLSDNEKNPLQATSYGTGELIRHALNKGIKKFIIGLGGSATNDGGAGILVALGVKLLDADGIPLPPGGSALINLQDIDTTEMDKRINDCSFLIASDVTNPLVGESGASFVFGPQKGATPQDVKELDASLSNYADVIEAKTGIQIHHNEGAGAAGGIGGMFQAFFPSMMKRGIDVVLNTISFERHIINASLIITGEGKSDSQTLSGKAPFGVAQVAKEKEIPVILISGMIEAADRKFLQPFFSEMHEIVSEEVSTEKSMREAAFYLERKTEQVMRSLTRNTDI